MLQWPILSLMALSGTARAKCAVAPVVLIHLSLCFLAHCLDIVIESCGQSTKTQKWPTHAFHSIIGKTRRKGQNNSTTSSRLLSLKHAVQNLNSAVSINLLI
jgi:hypothetical protein